MRTKSLGIMIIGTLTCAAACSGSPVALVCPNDSEPAIVLSVIDSATLARPSELPSLIVTDGAYADTLPSANGAYLNGVFGAAYDRPGTYTLTLRVTGYLDWFASPVVVPDDGSPCRRVKTVQLVAKIRRIPAG